MPIDTDDLRICDIRELTPPTQIMAEFPRRDAAAAAIAGGRQAIHDILHGADDRLVVVIGPCSIHDPVAALDFARRLRPLRASLAGELEIVMRVYFEKARTTIGWKGLINDPDLDGSFKIEKGLRLARSILAEISELGLPAGCEFLDMITPQYIADLVAWGAIGARTTESQVHRELASGLSCPVGFKNGTDGNVRIAIDAVKAASERHHFMAVTKEGRSAIAATTGNPDCHIVLRGGKTPNYEAPAIDAAGAELRAAGLAPTLFVDCSHANSGKNPENQPKVVESLARQIEAGERRIAGVMIESHLIGGKQDLVPGRIPTYGQSITDGCLDWDRSAEALHRLAGAVAARRAKISGAPRQAVG